MNMKDCDVCDEQHPYDACCRSEDGHHALDLRPRILEVVYADDTSSDPALTVDVNCYYCGQGTGVIIREADLAWT